jgi:DNA repair protein RadC
MLYVMDESGTYLPATQKEIFMAAKRLSSSHLRRGKVIKTSANAKEAIQHKFGGYEYEMFACLFLDSRNRLLEYKELFRGSVNYTIIPPREVVKEALRVNAAAVIFVHNHPSGEIIPSAQDLELTQKLRDILLVIDVKVLDHMIVGDTVMSMADEGYLARLKPSNGSIQKTT